MLFERVEEELAALPGVTGVTSSLVPLLAGSNWGTDVYVQGFPNGPRRGQQLPLQRGRRGLLRARWGSRCSPAASSRPSDFQGTPKVAIVNEAFAKKFDLGRGRGRQVHVRPAAGSLNIEIVGLVRDAKYSEVKDAIPPLFFLP